MSIIEEAGIKTILRQNVYFDLNFKQAKMKQEFETYQKVFQ